MLFLPLHVLFAQTDTAWPVACSNGGLPIGEENAVRDISSVRDRAQGHTTVQAAVDFRLPVPTQCAGSVTFVWLAVGAEQTPGPGRCGCHQFAGQSIS